MLLTQTPNNLRDSEAESESGSESSNELNSEARNHVNNSQTDNEPQGPPTHCAGCRALLPAVGRERGVVKWYNPRKRFGFIIRDDGSEIFAHGSKLRNGRRLPQDALVEFQVTHSKQGPAASAITILEESPTK
ncbi:MAG: cold shock domain-containing protein [Chloroflexota bacterium]